MLPGEGLSFVAGGSAIFEKADDALEDAAVEDGDGLPFGVGIFLLGELFVLVEGLLPVDEYFVGNQRVVLLIRNLEIS